MRVPNEPSLEAEGDRASRQMVNELSKRKFKEIQLENLTNFLAKAHDRTADDAVTDEALRVAGYLARSDLPQTMGDILRFARYKSNDTTGPIVDWEEHPHSKWNRVEGALRYYHLVPGPKGENGPHAIASSDPRTSEHPLYSKEFFASVLVEKETVLISAIGRFAGSVGTGTVRLWNSNMRPPTMSSSQTIMRPQ